jgi:hypothetical protein
MNEAQPKNTTPESPQPYKMAKNLFNKASNLSAKTKADAFGGNPKPSKTSSENVNKN